MTTITLFTDPHIGLNRNSHTTPASRLRLKKALAKQAINIEGNIIICLGDLFDSHDVDNNSLVDGLMIYQQSALVLFGNHDLSNRDDVYSAIEVLEESSPYPTPRRKPWDPLASTVNIAGIKFWYIDHKLSQTVFEEALQDAYNRAEVGDVLLLHCNYNSPFATQESTLNLTEDDAAILLDKFSYVLMGHEHAPRKLLDGRLLILGNTHPTGFSDISDKFSYTMTVEDGELKGIEPNKIWDVATGYLTIDWTELSDLASLGDAVQFISVNGVADAQHAATISRQVSDLWSRSDNLLMVRNNVSYSSDVAVNELDDELVLCQSIPERISAQLKGTKLEPVWERYLHSV